MSDVVYSVELQFLQNGGFNAPAAGMQRLQEKTTSWHNSLFTGTQKFSSMFGGAVDYVGGKMLDLGTTAASALGGALTAGLGAGLKMAFEFNEQIENTTLSLAAIANANGIVENMAGGMRVATDVVKEMRKDARELPGEFKDLENILQSIASAGAQMGVGMYGMEKMAAKTMTAAAVLKVPQQVAAREMAMMLEGNARHSMPFFQRLGTGMGTKEFNGLAPEKRLEVIRTALEKLDPAIAGFTNSWTGIKTTAIDAIRQGVGFVGLPIFNSVKDLVKTFNGVDKHGIKDWGISLGDFINNAFLTGVDAVKHWYPMIKTFSETMYDGFVGVFHRLGPVVGGVFEKIEEFLKDPAAFAKLEHIAEQLVALKIGTTVAGGALSAGSSMLPGLTSMAGGGAEGAAAVAEIAGPLALALAAVGVAAYGIVSALEDASSSMHGPMVEHAKELEINMLVLNHEFGKLGDSMKPLIEMFGLGFLDTLNNITGTLGFFGHALNEVMDTMYSIIGSKRLAHEDPNFVTVPERVTALSHLIEMNTGAEREKERKIPQHVTNIHKVEIKVNTNQDPNRIAKRTADILLDVARHPKVATLTGAPVFSR